VGEFAWGLARVQTAAMVQEPYCVALLIVDSIHVDPGTQKKFLMGTFNALSLPRLPSTSNSFVVFGVLSDGEGDASMRIKLADVSEDREPVLDEEFTLPMPSRLQSVEFASFIKGVSFDHEGDYRLQLWCRDSLLMERKIVVTVRRQP
jgi:hypothetical protein